MLPFCLSLAAAERVPLAANFRDSTAYRWVNKAVLEHRLHDGIESRTGGGWLDKPSADRFLTWRSQPSRAERFEFVPPDFEDPRAGIWSQV